MPRTGALDCQWYDRMWFTPSDALNRRICQTGMTIEIELKCTGEFTGNDFSAILTKGSFHCGFRILMRRDGHVLFQLARLGEKDTPLWLLSEEPLPRDRWVTLVCVYKPPLEGRAGCAVQTIDGKHRVECAVPAPMPQVAAVIGVGCEFKNPLAGPYGKFRPNFHGLIRRVKVSVP